MNDNRDSSSQAAVDLTEDVDRARSMGIRCNILLGHDRWIRVVAHPNGEVQIEFRQMSGTEVQNLIALPLKTYLGLRDSLKELKINFQKALKDECVNIKIHLGANVHASIKSPFKCVHIRKWYRNMDVNELRPGKEGVTLTYRGLRELCKIDNHIETIVPELTTTLICVEQLDHANQLGALMCNFCNPNMDNFEYL
jgi:hypothetical protein